jgi:hypothetical protein
MTKPARLGSAVWLSRTPKLVQVDVERYLIVPSKFAPRACL